MDSGRNSKLVLPLLALLVSAAVAFAAEYLRQRSKNDVANRAPL